MTPAEALQRAIIANDADRMRAWVAVAAELRAQAGAAPRLAVQDVEVRYCHHGVIVVRLPGGASEAWWHPGSKSWCDDGGPAEAPPTQPAATPARVRTREERQRIEVAPVAVPGGRTARIDPETGTASPVSPRTCASCGQMVEQAGPERWRHVATGCFACIPSVGGKGGTAWPGTP